MRNLTRRVILAIVLLLTPAMVAAHIDGEGSIVVQSVNPGSPAERAGLQAGDSLLRIAEQEVASNQDLQRILAAHRPGDTVSFIVSRRGDELELELTFGASAGGGVSVGVSLAITSMNPGNMPAGERVSRSACLAWIDETYRIESMIRGLGLDLQEEVATIRTCIENNVQRMPSPMPVAWCDNAFKIHCSAVDLLMEIGEVQVERCEALLGESLGSCAADQVFDRYARDGEASDAADCRAARDSCSQSE